MGIIGVNAPKGHVGWLPRTLVIAVALLTAVASTAVAAAGEDRGNRGGGPPDHAGERPPHSYPVQPSDRVAQPDVEGPVEGGIRTGEPYGTTLIEMDDGWIEEEFFFEGTARGYGSSEGDEEDYKTRILVRRPTDPRDFNGTVVLDWNNVTIPQDRDVAWHPLHLTLMERGYAYVAVAAQRLGVEFSPLALKQWDPVRYGDLHHPGDDYSWDMFSQAAEAVLDPMVLGELRPGIERRLAMGASQSAGRLATYINEVHEDALVLDGFQPQISGSVDDVRRDVVSTLWVNSGDEVGDSHRAEDTDLFRLWEISGSAHTSYGSTAYNNQVTIYAHSNGFLGDYDEEDGGAWGYQRDPNECLEENYMVVGHAWSAALVALDEWVQTGRAPESKRVERDEDGRVYDEHGNLAGGVRLPMVEVPIATYAGGGVPPGNDPCMEAGGRMPLRGLSRVFDEGTLTELYPTKEDFLTAFDEAIETALERGVILPEGAAELRRRAPHAAEILDRTDAALTVPRL